MTIPPPGPLAYEGAISIPFIIRRFSPTSSNYQFTVPTIWVNPDEEEAWILLAKPNNVAVWSLMGGPSGSILEILTPDGNTVLPTDGVIDLLNGPGLNITGAGNAVTFNSFGGGFKWNNVTASTQTLAPGNAYLAHSTSLITFTLPVTAAFGDSYIIAGFGSGGWTLHQNFGQTSYLGAIFTARGTSGIVSSTLSSDTVFITCIGANVGFKVLNWQGNPTVVQ